MGMGKNGEGVEGETFLRGAPGGAPVAAVR